MDLRKGTFVVFQFIVFILQSLLSFVSSSSFFSVRLLGHVGVIIVFGGASGMRRFRQWLVACQRGSWVRGAAVSQCIFVRCSCGAASCALCGP